MRRALKVCPFGWGRPGIPRVTVLASRTEWLGDSKGDAMRKILLLVTGLLLAISACSGTTMDPRAQSTGEPLPSVATTPAISKDPYLPDPIRPPADVPHWSEFRSQIGGLPVPQNFTLSRRVRDGDYRVEEEYKAPPGVDDRQTLAWYWARIDSDHGSRWGDWIPCFPGGNGAGLDDETGKPTWWAWRNPQNPDHVIRLDVIGLGSGDRGVLWLSRDDGGECDTPSD